MHDWESERAKPVVARNYNGAATLGPLKPYNELIEALGIAAAELQRQDRAALQRLAWALGMRGETHACQAIMAYAKEPEPMSQWTPWGYMTGI